MIRCHSRSSHDSSSDPDTDMMMMTELLKQENPNYPFNLFVFNLAFTPIWLLKSQNIWYFQKHSSVSFESHLLYGEVKLAYECKDLRCHSELRWLESRLLGSTSQCSLWWVIHWWWKDIKINDRHATHTPNVLIGKNWLQHFYAHV